MFYVFSQLDKFLLVSLVCLTYDLSSSITCDLLACINLIPFRIYNDILTIELVFIRLWARCLSRIVMTLFRVNSSFFNRLFIFTLIWWFRVVLFVGMRTFLTDDFTFFMIMQVFLTYQKIALWILRCNTQLRSSWECRLYTYFNSFFVIVLTFFVWRLSFKCRRGLWQFFVTYVLLVLLSS